MPNNTITCESRPSDYPVASVTITDNDAGSYATVRVASRSLIYGGGVPEPSELSGEVSVTVSDTDITTLYMPVVDASVLLSMTPEDVAREIVMNAENYDFHAPLSSLVIDMIPRSDENDEYDVEHLVNDIIEEYCPNDSFRIFGDVQTEVFDTDVEIEDPIMETYSVRSLMNGMLRSLRQSSFPAVRRPVGQEV